MYVSQLDATLYSCTTCDQPFFERTSGTWQTSSSLDYKTRGVVRHQVDPFHMVFCLVGHKYTIISLIVHFWVWWLHDLWDVLHLCLQNEQLTAISALNPTDGEIYPQLTLSFMFSGKEDQETWELSETEQKDKRCRLCPGKNIFRSCAATMTTLILKSKRQ